MKDKYGIPGFKKDCKCKRCGKLFSVTLKRDNGCETKFCSKGCRNKKVETICQVCGKKYKVIKYRLKKTKYCSIKCFTKGKKGDKNPNWRGGITPPSIYREPEWRKISREVIKRDGYTCQICGKKADETRLEVHHIMPYRLIQSHIKSNLVTLCKEHHAKSDWMVKDLLNMPQSRKDFIELTSEMYKTCLEKSSDYAEDKDPLSNLKMSEKFGVPAWKGTLIRMSDKWSRITQLSNKEAMVKDESIIDTLKDLSVYSLLCIILYENEKRRNK